MAYQKRHGNNCRMCHNSIWLLLKSDTTYETKYIFRKVFRYQELKVMQLKEINWIKMWLNCNNKVWESRFLMLFQ